MKRRKSLPVRNCYLPTVFTFFVADESSYDRFLSKVFTFRKATSALHYYVNESFYARTKRRTGRRNHAGRVPQRRELIDSSFESSRSGGKPVLSEKLRRFHLGPQKWAQSVKFWSFPLFIKIFVPIVEKLRWPSYSAWNSASNSYFFRFFLTTFFSG